jgi:mannose-6-phosphate isomerase-like protein (cupin superfamily)
VPVLVDSPTRIEAAGNKPKRIEEYIGRVNSRTDRVSIAHMHSPAEWQEPGQTPDFEEYTVVLKGALKVRHQHGELVVNAGQAVITRPGEWVQYSTAVDTEYIAICIPAFSPGTVRRDVDE